MWAWSPKGLPPKGGGKACADLLRGASRPTRAEEAARGTDPTRKIYTWLHAGSAHVKGASQHPSVATRQSRNLAKGTEVWETVLFLGPTEGP